MTETTVSLSENAAKRIAALIEKQGDPGLKFRLAVDGGGCSGFQYRFDFDKTVNEDDTIVSRCGVDMLVDEASLPFLEGAELDYVTDLVGAAFQVRNPNAQASCGCGSSFAI
ncbi:MAG: iron-sulfur cluster insertion protein ErpA [Pseudomonadota bacterium]